LLTDQASSQCSNPWLANVQTTPNAVLRLFCFPYAGGSSIAYHNWISALPDGVAVYPVQLPGRGGRWHEAAFTRMPDLIDAAMDGLAPVLTGRFAFFGHSMGALIAFELARRLAVDGRPGPEKLYVSGRKAPHCVDDQTATYLLSTHEFVERLRLLNGTPRAALEDPELLDLVLPIIRADFELVQTYKCEPAVKLECPIGTFGGEIDSHVSIHELEGWATHTSVSFSMELLSGDHFFILHQKQALLRSLSHDLDAVIHRNTANPQRLDRIVIHDTEKLLTATGQK
jgi:medium-chain acyl-[acyl-carrier-protein] hydrolase